MGQRHLDHDYVEEVVGLLAGLPAGARPRWGTMNRDQLIEHFNWAVRYPMGRAAPVPDVSGWFTRRVVKPVLLSGLVPMPRNVRLPKALARQGVTLREPGDLETLHAVLEEYVALVQADELQPRPHPVFGPLGVDEWDRLLVLHFEHHLSQFGLRA
jgi:hypothetical protein